MGKRRLAIFCLTIFMLAALTGVSQVSAHYTLGDQLPLPNGIGRSTSGGLPVNPSSGAGNGQPQYHLPSVWGGHAPGHIAFLRPGSLYVPPSDQHNYYSPDGAVITDTVGDLFLYICIADEITENDNEPITHADQAGPINISWRRITIPKSPPSSLEYSKLLYIAIPPEFTPTVNWAEGFPETLTTNFGLGDASNIETTITNDYNMIQTGKFWPRHPVAPNWWFIRITSTPVDFPLEREDDLTKLNPAFNPKYLNSQIYRGSSGFLYPPNMDPWLDRQISQENTNGFESEFAGCYRIKIRDMKAPSCAGKYFFKVFYTSTNQPFNSLNIMQPNSSPIYGFEGGWPDLWQMPDSPYGEAYINDPWSGYLNGYFEKYDTIPPENYPVLLVKGEAEPGYISGTVRYSGHSQYYYGTYYGDGVHTSGKVVAEGTAIDPKTNEPTGRPVCATGYFLGEVPGQGQPFLDRGTGSQGLYEIEGLAPGIYTLTAYAAGFVPRTLSTQITVKTGQSIHGIDIYVYPTAKIQTRVYSKCPTGPVDFPDYVTMDGFPANEAILPVVPGGADVRGKSFNSRAPVSADGVWYWFTEGATTVQAKNLWGELMSSGVSGPITPAQLSEFVAPGGVPRIPTAKRFGWAWQELVDISGTVTAWQDFTFDLTEDRRSFNTFWGDPSCYSGVETMWDGHVPTFLADFTSGISPGNYWVRTWVFGYVQPKEYQVSFTEVDFPGTVYTEMDLFKGGTINMTVHFHQQELPSAEMTDAQFDAVPSKNPLVIEAIDAYGVKQAWNLTDNGPWSYNFDNSRGQSLILVGDSNAWCLEGRVHGMREGTYTIKAFLHNFIQQEFPQQTIQYCTNSSASFHLVRGALFNVTVYSRNCQDPTQPVNWAHPGELIIVHLTIEEPQFYSLYAGGVQVGTADFARIEFIGGGGGGMVSDYFRICGLFRGAGVPSGVYKIYVYTVGYIQLQVPEVFVMKGSSTVNIPIYLVLGPEIRVIVDFKTELIPAPLPPDFHSYYFRIEVFDENGTLAAAKITAVPKATFQNHDQYPWLGSLNPAQPLGVKTWVFQLFGFSPSTTPTNTPNWIVPFGIYPFTILPAGIIFPQYPLYNDGGRKLGAGDHLSYGIMWGETYTILVTEENQIGYTQLATVTAMPTCGGATTVVLEMDRMARISGFVYTRNWMGDFRAGSWLETTATSAAASIKAWGPIDGYYYAYVIPDTYTVTAEGPGYESASRTVVTTWGGASDGQDFYLEDSGVPLPELPATGLLALVSALAASLYLLRWRK